MNTGALNTLLLNGVPEVAAGPPSLAEVLAGWVMRRRRQMWRMAWWRR